jgi:hypothetical protein
MSGGLTGTHVPGETGAVGDENARDAAINGKTTPADVDTKISTALAGVTVAVAAYLDPELDAKIAVQHATDDAAYQPLPTGPDVAFGPNTQNSLTTGGADTAIGGGAQYSLTTGSNDTAVGQGAQQYLTTGGSDTAIGESAQFEPLGVGANATTTASNQTSVGTETGQSSATQVDGITTIGYRAVAGAANASSLGARARADHSGSVALGSDTLTTATGQVMVGPRDVEITDTTKGVVIKSPDGTRYRITVANGGALSTGAGSIFGQLPDAVEQVAYVTPRGNDSNNGLSPKSAKLTIAAALTALAGNPGTIYLGAGTITTAATHTLPGGTSIIGAARGMTTIAYTGTGALFQATSGTRTYDIRISGIVLAGPAMGTGTAIDLVDASMSRISDCTFNNWLTAVSNRSTISGGAVYNRVYDCMVNSCTTGVLIGATGSNSARIRDTKFGACTIGVSITDSNENAISDCEFEACTTAVKIDATGAGSGDFNSISTCRFESNPTAFNIASAYVRYSAILNPAIMGSGGVVADSSTSTSFRGGGFQNFEASAQQDALGAWRFTRIANGGSELPNVVISDPVTTSGTPVSLQVETGRSAGFFFRGMQSGSKNAEITATGQGRFVAGIGVGNSAAATTPGSVVKKIQVFDATGTSLGYIAVYSAIT